LVLPSIEKKTESQSQYRGRFAPSPTGPLHAGSILAALASYLDAKANQGLWFVRMEDLDPPRESPAAAKSILQTLETLGLHWDDQVVYQGQRQSAYRDALAELGNKKLIYPCQCSRQVLADYGNVYPGICRTLNIEAQIPVAVRCRVSPATISFTDRIQGNFFQHLETDVGDFVILRKEGLFAYQLAVVVDDAWQGITDIVRGIDLLDSTPRQIYLQQILGFRLPRYAHIPILINAQGQKLGKQQYAEAVSTMHPGQVLFKALQRLHQDPEPELENCTPEEILAWGKAHWDIKKLAGIKQIPEI
jgi:glutamyl-Q tRNA(Asp) synthetase